MFNVALHCATFAFVALTALPVHAQDSALEPLIEPLMKGQQATFTGLLVPEKRYITFLEAETNARDFRGKLSIEAKKHDALEAMYQDKLKQASKPTPWYKEPSFNRWVGFGIGVAVATIAIYGGAEMARAGQ